MSFEPYKIKMVEHIHITTKEERSRYLKEAKYNPFNLKSRHVMIDLLTDSGTSAMSDCQWSSMFLGDETYAGAKSSLRFKSVIQDITGFPYIIPVHQGRAAEKILFKHLLLGANVAYSNGFFDTTRAHVETNNCIAVDIPVSEMENEYFQGNIDCCELKKRLSLNTNSVGMVLMTVTNNVQFGQPVSLANIKEASSICKEHNIPFIVDACRFAENSWFVKLYENDYTDKTPKEIAKEMFELFDGCTMSAKKDGISNIGGFIAIRDPALLQNCNTDCILNEGFFTYGGMAGRDMEAIATGLEEALNESYLSHRIGMIEQFGQMLQNAGVSIKRAGGHAIYVDARKVLPHIPCSQYPAWTLTCELYREGGIRAVEIGNVMFGADGKVCDFDLLRLAIPRRVYTMSHLEYVVEAFKKILYRASSIRGMQIVKASNCLRHFTVEMEYVASEYDTCHLH